MTVWGEILKIVLFGSIVALFIAANALFLVWMERRVAARIQIRRGPIHVGFQGSLQTVADAIKLISKELTWPKNADKFCYWLAPVLVFSPLLCAFLIFPFSKNFILRDLKVGCVFLFPPFVLGFFFFSFSKIFSPPRPEGGFFVGVPAKKYRRDRKKNPDVQV